MQQPTSHSPAPYHSAAAQSHRLQRQLSPQPELVKQLGCQEVHHHQGAETYVGHGLVLQGLVAASPVGSLGDPEQDGAAGALQLDQRCVGCPGKASASDPLELAASLHMQIMIQDS